MSGRILCSERREESAVQGRTHTDLYNQNQATARCGPAGECQGTGKSGLCAKGQNQQFAENGRNAANAQAAYERLSQAEDELYKINEQIHYAGQYISTKEVQQQFTKAILKKKFRAEYSKELDAYAESVKYFWEENDGKLPSLKSLKKRKEKLTQEIAERKKAYAPLREESRRLEIASDNVYGIFRKTNEMKSDLAWKREWEAKVREKARQEQVRQEQRVRQPKRKKRSYDMSL